MAGGQKTYSLSGGWYSRFNIVVAKAHPDFYSAVAESKKEQACSESLVTKLSAGKRGRMKSNLKYKFVILQIFFSSR